MRDSRRLDDRAVIEQYLQQSSTRKLHLGCGHHILPGWLNCDYAPPLSSAITLDVTRTFPFMNDTFDYVFSEHLIEHLPYTKGQFMLTECLRVLKVGGRIRMSTPDLAFLISLYRKNKSRLQRRYIRWTAEEVMRDVSTCSDTFVINNFVRAWGHTFIYDEKTLRFLMNSAGFHDIIRVSLNISEYPDLRYLENERRLPAGFLELETLTLEGSKRNSADAVVPGTSRRGQGVMPNQRPGFSAAARPWPPEEARDSEISHIRTHHRVE